jgi:nucleotide-binding universal stress UspA family protein
MALKDLLVCVDQTEDALLRLRLAADLAARHRSRITALFAREWTRAQLDRRKAAELGLVSSEKIRQLDEGIAASIKIVEGRLQTTLDELIFDRGIQATLLSIDGPAAMAVPQYARYADLCILGQNELEGPASVNYTFSEQLLFVTGRPVLFVPANYLHEILGRHIVVAWNSSRPAARSLNDAIPLIERADRTTIVMINPSGFIDSHEGPPGEQLAEHLARHGATVDSVRIENVAHGAIADRLQAEALALGADMIVGGAFGHPRLWEKMLGGVTRDLMARMTLPVFMSH